MFMDFHDRGIGHVDESVQRSGLLINGRLDVSQTADEGENEDEYW